MLGGRNTAGLGLKELMLQHKPFPVPCRTLPHAPLSFQGIKEYLEQHNIEGIVWHHPDGRLVKVKSRDFGLPWGSGGGK